MWLSLGLSEEQETALDRLDKELRDSLVNNCVQAILVLGQERNPIKREILNKLVFSTTTRRSLPSAIIHKANIELNKTFGMQLFEIEDKSKLLLVNSKTEFAKFHHYDKQMCQELTVLYFMLMDIFPSPGEKRSEEDLLVNIKGLDCDEDTLKGYLESFVKKLYLVLSREHGNKMYEWGPRTIAETDLDKFFEQFLQLTGSTESEWPDLKKRIDTLKKTNNNR